MSPQQGRAAAGSPSPGRYDHRVTETALPLDQQLEEIRAQLSWVRDYL
jgi:hypothetical protein